MKRPATDNRPRRRLPAPAVLLAGFWILGGCSRPDAPDDSPQARGEALFRKEGCSACHKPGGTGGTLQGVASRRTLESFEAYLRDPAAEKPGTLMPSFGRLTAGEMGDLWAYLRSRPASDEKPPSGD